MFIKTIFFFVIIFFSSCAQKTISSVNKPSWLIDLGPYSNRSVATGCSRRHAKGFNAQKELAISRATNELAMQKGTIVNVVINNRSRRNNGRLIGSRHDSKSSHKVSNINVEYKTLETFYDEKNKRYCILIESSN